ncbi:MAG: hypothetical protein AAB355_01940 [Patescibacteria group bacterium]
MFYIFYGKDRDKRAEKIKHLLETECGGAPPRPIRPEEIRVSSLGELARSRELFGGRAAFLLDEISEQEDWAELIKKNAKLLSESENIFIVNEPSLTKAAVSSFEKGGGKVVFCDGKDKAAPERGGNFALADAIGRRDRKASWVLYHEALAKGAVPEEIHGIIFWQLKNIFLAKSGGPTGIAPYPLAKAKSFATKWGSGELSSALSKLVAAYHESHRGIVEFPIALEMFLLESV